MLHDKVRKHDSSFRKIAFSHKVRRVLDRSPASRFEFGPAEWPVLKTLLDDARQTLDLAQDEIIQSLIAHNPEVMRVTRSPESAGIAEGLFAYLPLNDAGVQALITGGFDGRRPEIAWICSPGEVPEAIYLWLVFMPGSLAKSLGVIARGFDELVPQGCPVFSKAVTPHAERLNASMGFVRAEDFYPGCQQGLLVIFPERASIAPPKPKVEIEIARTIEDIFQVFSVRSATYIAEQFCLYSEEFDGNDFCATQFLGKVDGDAAGCIRARFFEGFAKIERLAVRAEYRNSRLAYQLVRAALEHCRMKGYRKVYGHSRLDLVRFWRVFGFKPIDGRETFSFANVKYTEILLDQDAHPDAITLEADPMVVIRPEGAWDRPGPFDLSPSALDPRRKQLLEARTRTIGRQKIVA
jgi:predicted GNAT family N-acyltransferase